ncbi:YidH family protein [Corynebacterium lowii]|uniref:Inner membrane protein YidH n=1 Tax=Corynebacterium lowii TaxID=1544413 RepID=A0A0Q1AGI0_9CORY|nr:DUF202 domain-containing protein [Corynebacterium lowii]KQB85752.1 Inner membrane protein YidH [Corynebacterium lowii]MDP9851054.1 putative membrane protein [Corynebacterium lowii]
MISFARRLFPRGTEPDPRFTLANERTFLAWTRSALAFIAAGVALKAFGGEVAEGALCTALAVGACCLGVLIAVGAAVRWVQVERAMREDRPLPVPTLVPVLMLGAVAAGIGAMVVFLE